MKNKLMIIAAMSVIPFFAMAQSTTNPTTTPSNENIQNPANGNTTDGMNNGSGTLNNEMPKTNRPDVDQRQHNNMDKMHKYDDTKDKIHDTDTTKDDS
jgi:hypothetical protein